MAGTDYAVRHCNGCGKDKPLSEEFFYSSGKGKAGFRFRCIECDRATARERQRRRLSDPRVYAEVLAKNRERAAKKRGPQSPLPTRRKCVKCQQEFPATTEFFSPRKNGRLKLTCVCKPCQAFAARERRRLDPDARAKHIAAVTRVQKRRLATDPVFRARKNERERAADKRRRADPEYAAKEWARRKAWRQRNLEHVRERNRRYAARLAAHQAGREAAKLRATPPWSEKEKIRALYVESKRLTDETGVKHNVDHIIPLRGKLACGLHVFANLRVVTEFENKTKSNKHIEHLAA